MPIDPIRVQAVFLAAVISQNPADRNAVLDRECGTDLELRQRVESLLRAHDETDDFLDQPVVGPIDPSSPDFGGPDGGSACENSADFTRANSPPPPDVPAPGAKANGSAPPPITEGPGNLIGPYKLLQKIGEGGMGAVYMAQQEKPVRRRVAVKIIKPGMDSEQVLTRFDAEPRHWP